MLLPSSFKEVVVFGGVGVAEVELLGVTISSPRTPRRATLRRRTHCIFRRILEMTHSQSSERADSQEPTGVSRGVRLEDSSGDAFLPAAMQIPGIPDRLRPPLAAQSAVLRQLKGKALHAVACWAVVYVVVLLFALKRCVRTLGTSRRPATGGSLEEPRLLAEEDPDQGANASLQLAELLCLFSHARSGGSAPAALPESSESSAGLATLTTPASSQPTPSPAVTPSELLPHWALHPELPDLGPDVLGSLEEEPPPPRFPFEEEPWSSPTGDVARSAGAETSAAPAAPFVPSSSRTLEQEAAALAVRGFFQQQMGPFRTVEEGAEGAEFRESSPVFEVSDDSSGASETEGEEAAKRLRAEGEFVPGFIYKPREYLRRLVGPSPRRRRPGKPTALETESEKTGKMLELVGLTTFDRRRRQSLRSYMIQFPKRCFYFPGDPSSPDSPLTPEESRALNLFFLSSAASSSMWALDPHRARLAALKSGADERAAEEAAQKAAAARAAWAEAARNDPLYAPPIFPTAPEFIKPLAMSTDALFMTPNAPEAAKLCRLIQRTFSKRLLEYSDVTFIRSSLERLLTRIPRGDPVPSFGRLEAAGRALARWVMTCDFIFLLNAYVPDFVPQAVVQKVRSEMQRSFGPRSVHTLHYGTVDSVALFILLLRSYAAGRRPHPVLLVHAKRIISNGRYNSAFDWNKAHTFLTDEDLALLEAMNMHSRMHLDYP